METPSAICRAKNADSFLPRLRMLHWIVMLWHIVMGCLLLGLPGVLLLYYALSQTEIESKTLHIMEDGVLRLS
jgi:acyl-coenzyme A synthetase/AMP-(fatty) acid ligase